jgi:hypothetical protein
MGLYIPSVYAGFRTFCPLLTKSVQTATGHKIGHSFSVSRSSGKIRLVGSNGNSVFSCLPLNSIILTKRLSNKRRIVSAPARARFGVVDRERSL